METIYGTFSRKKAHSSKILKHVIPVNRPMRVLPGMYLVPILIGYFVHWEIEGQLRRDKWMLYLFWIFALALYFQTWNALINRRSSKRGAGWIV